jgi:pimeloyl-ACP methyl ester carboxylesterase
MRLVQRGYTVLAPDLPGHGSSSSPLGDYSLGSHASSVRDLLDLLGIERVTVVGHSFGGGVAMQFPGRCERMVLVDAGGLGREVNWILRLATVPAAEYVMPVLFPVLMRRWGDPVARFLRAWGIRNGRAADVWRSYRSLTDPGNRAAFVRTARAVIDPGGQSVSAANRLYLVALMPTLIVWGGRTRSSRWITPGRPTRPSPVAGWRSSRARATPLTRKVPSGLRRSWWISAVPPSRFSSTPKKCARYCARIPRPCDPGCWPRTAGHWPR